MRFSNHLVATTALAVAAFAMSGPAFAGYKASVNALPNFAEGITRIAIVTEQCHPAVDCTAVESRIFSALRQMEEVPWTVLYPALVGQQLFELGYSEFNRESTAEIAQALEVDALLVVSVPDADRETKTGWGTEYSEGTIELTLIPGTAERRVLFHGRATGRARLATSSREGVLGKAAEAILNHPVVSRELARND